MTYIIGSTDKAGRRAVEVGTYDTASKSKKAYVGWIEPKGKNPQWIIFLLANGDAHLYTEREPDGAVTSNCTLLKAEKPKRTEKKVTIELTMHAHGKRRKPCVGAAFEPGLLMDDEEAYGEFHKAAKAYCKHLIERGEL